MLTRLARPNCRRFLTLVSTLAISTLATLAGPVWAQTSPDAPATMPARASRPRVLLRGQDLLAWQARCGIKAWTGDRGIAQPAAELGSHAADYRAIAEWVDRNLDLPLEDGALYLPAFMHLLTGEPGRSDRYTRAIESELLRRRALAIDFDDQIAALDWCWDALDLATQRNTAQRLLGEMAALQPADSPLDHFLFHPKLCHVAAAIALEDYWPEASEERRRVGRILEAAEAYFNETLIQYLRQLGGMAPASVLQADFEADALYAIELWDRRTNGAYWPKVADIMQHACDRYFWAESDWPGLNGALMHDHGSRAAGAPGAGMTALAAGAADVLAHRTGSPVAAWYAQFDPNTAVQPTVRDLNHRWLRIVHRPPTNQIVDRVAAPLARNLGNGWVLMRSAWRPGATVVAFDAGQPYWIARQHFDAGQFQIIHKGRLALDSGDDVKVGAVPGRGGAQGLGEREGEFNDYAAATVAHNCVLLADTGLRPKYRGRDWLAAGNQRLIEDDYRTVNEPIAGGDRQTGRLLSFETNAHYSFAGADLAAAYPARVTQFYDRQLLFVGGTYLFVIDRILTERPDVGKTWLLHLPTRPRVGGADLDPQFRRRGKGNAAGDWCYPQFDGWLATDGGDGRLFVKTLLPADRQWRLIGGPMTVATVRDGPYRGRSYVGSTPDGFEHWLTPGSSSGGLNAWYRLGKPDALGPLFGVGAGWGRLEVEPSDREAETLFVHLLIPQDRKLESPPEVATKIDGDTIEIAAAVDDVAYQITLTPKGPEPGRVRASRGGQVIFDQAITTKVAPNTDVPVHR